MMLNWKKYFEERPCNEALEWIEENGIETMSEAWQKCERGDWLVWALEHRSDGYALTKLQRVEIAVRLVRLTPVGDGRTVFDLLEDPRSINAIEVAGRYVAGVASDDELREAARAAVEWAARAAAARAARAAAARAAAWAADAAAVWAASAAADAAADAATVVRPESVAATTARKAQADIIRQWWPVWSPEGETDV